MHGKRPTQETDKNEKRIRSSISERYCHTLGKVLCNTLQHTFFVPATRCNTHCLYLSATAIPSGKLCAVSVIAVSTPTRNNRVSDVCCVCVCVYFVVCVWATVSNPTHNNLDSDVLCECVRVCLRMSCVHVPARASGWATQGKPWVSRETCLNR